MTDTSPAGNGGCASVSNTITYPVVVFAGAFHFAHGDPGGVRRPVQVRRQRTRRRHTCVTPPADPYTYQWEVKDANTNAVIFTSTDKTPIYTFAYTGDFIAVVTVTDCSGVSQTGSCSVNYNGPMSGTLSS